MEMKQKRMWNSVQRKWYGTNRKSDRGRTEIIKTIQKFM